MLYRTGRLLVMAPAVVLTACMAAPDAEEGTRRLTGQYVLRDVRPDGERNPEWRTAKLVLNPDAATAALGS